jgi:hypothetical protein
MVANRINTKWNEILLDDEGILILKPSHGAEMDLEEVKACFEAYKALGIGPNNKVLEIIDVQDSTMTDDARVFAAENGSDYFIAAAIISNSLAIRIMVNFFNVFYKQLVPFKMFSNEEAARNWLRTFKK